MSGIAPSARDLAAGLSPRARFLAVIAVAIAFLMELVDTTIVNIAIPTIQGSLGASDTNAQWMVSGYLTAFAILLVTGGRLGDIFGYRTMFLSGIVMFTFSSFLCGIAPTPEFLVGARVLQGATAAIMLPQVMALIQLMYPPHERISVLAVFGVVGGLAAVLGPIIGGLLITADVFGLQWRTIFLINIPIGALALAVGIHVLPGGRSHHTLSLDGIGTLLLAVALLLILFPLVEGRQYGWPIWTILMLIAAPVLAAAAWKYFRRRSALGLTPLIEPLLFSDKSFSLGIFLVLIFQIVGGGFFLTLTLMLQYGLGMSAFEAALMHVPFAVGATFSIGIVTRKMLPRTGPVLLTAGASLYSVAIILLLLALHMFDGTARLIGLEIALLAAGLGMGLVSGPATPITLSEVDLGHAGSAAGILKSTQQIGSALGASMIGSVFFGLTIKSDPQTAIFAFSVGGILMLVCLIIVGLVSLKIPRNLKIFSGGRVIASVEVPVRVDGISIAAEDKNPGKTS